MTEASRRELQDAATQVLVQLDELTDEVQRLRERGRLWIIGLALFVAAVLTAGTLAAFDARAQDRKQSQSWCSLLNTVTAPSRATPPATEQQRDTLAELNKLRDRFGCR